jgi:transcriptional regulator with XRE-family HTH domain
MKQVHQALRHFRQAKGLTQKQVETLTGIAQPLLSRYESDTLPSLETASRLAVCYGISVDSILTFELQEAGAA